MESYADPQVQRTLSTGCIALRDEYKKNEYVRKFVKKYCRSALHLAFSEPILYIFEGSVLTF